MRLLIYPPAIASLLLTLCCALPSRAADSPPKSSPATRPAWADAMRKVHAKFTGKPGTFAQFGDSITVTVAFWSPLEYELKNFSPEAEKDLQLVKGYMRKECWHDWKGPKFGSEGGMTIRWARQNVDRWLKDLNPEAVLIMFGTNDLNGVPLDEYTKLTREVVRKCLDNGTVVILSTIPPRAGKFEQAKQYAEAVRGIAKEWDVPLEDYFDEVVTRRPDDWDGSLHKFKDPADKDGYNVPTLISRDGVHPSAPKQYAGDYSDEALNHHGYGLRSTLALRDYATVIRNVLKPADAGK